MNCTMNFPDLLNSSRYGCIALSAMIVSALLLTASSEAQQVSAISGTVRVITTEAPVDGATIQVEGTALITRSDSLGRFIIRAVPPGPQVLMVRRLGYAVSRVSVNVPASGTITVEVIMATSALQLSQVKITGDLTARARGELGTASVLDRDAIAAQTASTLAGVLELLPGIPIQAPGLDASSQFSLRSLGLGTVGTGGGVSGPGASAIGAAGTLIILDGVPLSNNANLQSVGPRGEARPAASTSGGGIDLRRIPATTIERVEVIRGVPSARWGDLTQGAIVVDTRANAAAPELLGRYDPRTGEGSVVGGRSFQNDKQSVTVAANLARTASASTLASTTIVRGSGQVAHRLQLGEALGRVTSTSDMPLPRLSLDTRLDWYQLSWDAPERVDISPGRISYQNDNGLRVGERARLALGQSGMLEWTLSYDTQDQESREQRRLIRTTVPFTDRLTEGRNIGTFIEGQYDGKLQLLGAPRMLYSRMEYEHDAEGAFRTSNIRIGAELRREWNAGEGYLFDIRRPPQVSTFNGTSGFDRPIAFDTIPALATSAIYADTRLSLKRGEMFADIQPGLRLETLHESGSFSGVRSAQLQPRLSVQLSPRPWSRLRGGIGVVSKTPTVAQLSPAQQFYDLVNVNRYTPDPAERLAVITTYIRDPSNPELGLSRALKRELGFELDGGPKWGTLSVTAFNDGVRGAATIRRDPSVLERARYALVDTAQGTGRPGQIVDPPLFYEPVPIFLDRYVNGGRLDSKGVEFMAVFPAIPQLRTRLELSGARITTDFATDDKDFGSYTALSTFQIDTTIKRVGYTTGRRSSTQQTILTWRLVHHQPEVGLIITATVQQRMGYKSTGTIASGERWFEGYLNRDGELIAVPESERGNPEYADLRSAGPGTPNFTTILPDDWVVSLQIAKSLGRSGRMSFYIFNATDKFLTFNQAASARVLPSSRFGAEVTLPFSDYFY